MSKLRAALGPQGSGYGSCLNALRRSSCKKVLLRVDAKYVAVVCRVQWNGQLELQFDLYIPLVQTLVEWLFPGIPGSASSQATTVSSPRPPIGGRPRHHHRLSHSSTKPAQYHHVHRTIHAATPRRFSHRSGPTPRRHTTPRAFVAAINCDYSMSLMRGLSFRYLFSSI